jgi:hypothetical protein
MLFLISKLQKGDGMKRKEMIQALSVSAVLMSASMEVLAGMTVPGPIVGATGPYGIGAAVIGYGGYKLYKHIKSKRK